MRIITEKQLAEILSKHKKWIMNEDGGEQADLSNADLRNADLWNADLSNANLSNADLRNADLWNADLSKANLSNADLRNAELWNADLRNADLWNADLRNAELRNADLRNADLRNADLSNADLRNADLSNADLRNADLSYVKSNEGTGFLALACPEEGAFIGWKTAHGLIIKLRITDDAKRSSATTRKCRCSKAEVLEIQTVDGDKSDVKSVPSDRSDSFLYTVGETVEVSDFNENRWNECASGIHFFITRAEAVNYGK